MSDLGPREEGAVPLESVLITGELARRPSRPVNYESRYRATCALAEGMAQRPERSLQKLVETVLDLCRAQSAGVSVLEQDGGREVFRWQATAGAYAKFAGHTVARNTSPCGVTLDRGEVQLFREPARHFAELSGATPIPLEGLVAPFRQEHGPAGALWAVAHDPNRRFDAADAHLLTDLASYAAVAVQTLGTISESHRARGDAERARQQLRHSEGRLGLMIESATDYAIFSLDVDGRIVTWNRGAERIFGWPEAEIVGQDGAVLFTPEDRLAAVPEGEQAKALETGRAEDERWHLRKDGSRFYASGVVTPLRDGRLMGFTKVARDMTARKRHEDRHRFMTALADQTRGSADADGVVWAVVSALGEQFTASRCAYSEVDEAAGSSTVHRDYCDGVPSIAGTYPLDSFGPPVIRELRAGKTVAVADVRNDPRTRGREGAYAALGCRAYATVPLVKDGRLVATLNVIADRPRRWDPADIELLQEVSERLWAAVATARALASLAASEGRLQLAIEIAQMGMFEIDLDTDAVVVNEPGRAIYGWESRRTTFTRVRSHFHPEDADEVLRTVQSAFDPNGLRTYEVEHRIVRADGDVGWIRVRGRAVFANVGGTLRAVRCVGTYMDVTERKRAEEELRNADRKKDDFLALLAHELRNPLAPIRNGLQVIRLSEDRLVRQRSQEMMDRQLGHMVRLIDDLLDVSRISRNKMNLQRTRVLLSDVLANAIETVRPTIDAMGHDLVVSIPPEPIFLDADLVRLAQVFSNLLSNSAKYTERGGRIWVSAAAAEDFQVAVAVRDTGIGIPAGALDTIFDMFAQVDRSIERTTGGLGIGLALVRGLVEMHGGTVEAISGGVGQGSTFTVRVPMMVEHTDPSATKSAVPRSAAFGRRILVVDDNRDGARSMADMLALLGSEVATAHDGLEAVTAAESFRPEAILMDLGMPRLNGLDATRRIREKPWGKPMAIIALTGWGQESDRALSKDAGCDRHLVKPVSLADLQKLLGELTDANK